jgi:FMN phosphatase YigB (HAD superfamily)
MHHTSFNPKKHIFLWDLHEVILKKDMKHWIMICITFKKKWELVRSLNKKSLYIILIFILERLGIIKKQMVSEELIQEARNSGNNALVELVIQVCSSYTPIKGTVLIIHELSQRGYKHHLGSNIGKTVYDSCIRLFPDIFSHFEGYSIPFITPENTFIKKPHSYFFVSHSIKYNLPTEDFIFIDDKKINVQAAQSIGMHAIHFKNSEQLREELIKYNIL